jgi:hypothetical protein
MSSTIGLFRGSLSTHWAVVSAIAELSLPLPFQFHYSWTLPFGRDNGTPGF